VRSSGTAEDLAGASFAGQYETFLDVRGSDALLDAVKRCWASMWTARVTAYRHNKGFEKAATGIAVVVQMMVEPEVAGVMFVGNPMNARADEIVINASWGLGEMVVSGSVTPDEYIVGRDSLKVKRRTLGSKELRVVRDHKAGKGTIKEPVPAKLQEQYTLSDDQAATLAEMGKKVTAYYGGLPQDIEWAMANNSSFLLQSRPITGVEFTWEEDLDIWPSIPQEEDAIWTRAAADEWWTGAITPLFWSIRGYWIHAAAAMSYKPFGMGDLAEMRWMKWSRGTMYYNTRVDSLMAEYSLPPSLREPMLRRLHPSQHKEAMNKPFDLGQTLKMFANIELNYPAWSGPKIFTASLATLRMTRKGGELYDQRRQAAKVMVPSQKELQGKTDDELRQMIEALFPGVTMREPERAVYLAKRAQQGPPAREGGGWGASFLYGPVIQALLEGVIKYWYTGTNPNAFTEVISGLPELTQQFHDDYDFWKLGETIWKSKKLKALINQFEGAAFFEELKNHEEGRAFLSQYAEFMEMGFFRGHADRDIYYARRSEDPNIDYRALRLLATAPVLESLEEKEERLIKRRETATADVIENLSSQPLGDLKVPVFKFLQGYCFQMLISRDEGRAQGEFVTLRKKLVLGELGRRAVERGLLEAKDDHYFLSIYELTELLQGKGAVPLSRAKVTARKKAFFSFLTHQEDPPMFLKGNAPLDSGDEVAVGNMLKGFGTSPGVATGRARVIPTQKDIGRLEKGDILVCHGTDPGWTSAFSIVSGVVAQTGGMLAHFSCLSREYGLPAVSLPGCMKMIKDGDMITVNGSTGEIRLASV
jgi:pyruvate,water dikinase